VPWLIQLASKSTDVLDRPLPGLRTPLTVSWPGLPRRSVSQSSSAVASVPMLRSLTVILIRSPGDRSSADADMAASSPEITSPLLRGASRRTPVTAQRQTETGSSGR
jgi:hypothetical protein